MTRRRAWLLMGVALIAAAPASAETLREAMAAAWEGNPELAAARARQEALAEMPNQARAAGRLTAGATGNAGYDRLGSDGTGVRTGSTSALGGVNATLPIWTGGRVSSAVRAAKGDVAAGGEGLRDVEADVLERVVGAYADLLYTQQAVEVARVGIARLDSQVAEARSRYGLGQATRTDVAQLEAQRASVVANLVDAEAAAATAAAAYRAIVGRDAGVLDATIATPAALPRTLADARAAAEAGNPLLLAQQRRVEAATARIDQARADGAPAVDLAGGYGRGVQWAGGQANGFDSAANAGLALRIPLLTGGLVASRVRQAEAVRRAERFDADAVARGVLRAADTAWASLTAAQGRLTASAQGLKAADLALKGVRAEYGFGLRSTIDILVADQSYRAAQLAVARAQVDVLIAEAALLRATGRMGRGAFG
ncbi:TolC family outer membrane protein [Sphingomonas parapaucimobilis]|uniref:Putative TolC-like protein n=1 Tax=Sphingomonas parapaucimobilis NBRC 15100 TaxID=1219049 RepID=A0A0A1WCC4_9SPHN|nr:TolC family outer membrane protein [Sphingomonas parapaucimobilis]GAM02609.1 putative TolC-like protein [Sphingomonas parapaucimobilis NBRC 15100]